MHVFFFNRRVIDFLIALNLVGTVALLTVLFYPSFHPLPPLTNPPTKPLPSQPLANPYLAPYHSTYPYEDEEAKPPGTISEMTVPPALGDAIKKGG